ncbi:Uncharacterised protein [Vibrio cholerae]|nr:Uncharacterised protein [Vibrio cholerae]
MNHRIEKQSEQKQKAQLSALSVGRTEIPINLHRE